MTDYYKKYLKYKKKYLKLNGGGDRVVDRDRILDRFDPPQTPDKPKTWEEKVGDRSDNRDLNPEEIKEEMKKLQADLVALLIDKELNYEIKSSSVHCDLSKDCITLVDVDIFDDNFLNSSSFYVGEVLDKEPFNISNENAKLLTSDTQVQASLSKIHPDLMEESFKFYVDLAGGTVLKLICVNLLMDSSFHQNLYQNTNKDTFEVWYKKKLLNMTVWHKATGGTYDTYLKNINEDDLKDILKKPLIDIIKEQIENLSDIDLKVHTKLSPTQITEILQHVKVDYTTLINIILARIKIGNVTKTDLPQYTGKYGEQLDIGLPVLTHDFLSKLSHSNLNDLDKIIYEMIYIVAKDRDAKEPKRLSRLQRLIILYYFEVYLGVGKSIFSIKTFLQLIISNKTYNIKNLPAEFRGGNMIGGVTRITRIRKPPDFYEPEQTIGQIKRKKRQKNININQPTIRQIIEVLESYSYFKDSGIGKITIELIDFVYLDKEYKDLQSILIKEDYFYCPLLKYNNLNEYRKRYISVLIELLTIYNRLDLDSIKKKIPKNLFSEIWNIANDKQIAQIIKKIDDEVEQVYCIILLSIQKLITKTLTEIIASFGPELSKENDNEIPFQNWAKMLYYLVYDENPQSIQEIVRTKMKDSRPNDLFPDNIHNVDLLTSGINKINEAMQTIIYIPIIIKWTQQINTYLTPPFNSFTLPNFSFWTNKKLKDSWDEHPKIGHYPIRAQVSHLHVIKHETDV